MTFPSRLPVLSLTPMIVLVSAIAAVLTFSHGLHVAAVLVSTGIVVAFIFPPPLLIGLLFATLALGSSRYLSGELYFVRFEMVAVIATRGLADLLKGYPVTDGEGPRAVIGLLGGFGLLAVCSALYSPVPSITLQRGFSWILMLVALGLYVWLYVRTKEDAEQVVLLFVYVAIGAVLAGFVSWLLDGAGAFNGPRFRGIFENPNTVGSVLMLATVPALWRFHATHRFQWGIAILIFALALALAGSRSAVLAVGVSLVVYYVLRGLRGRATVASLGVSLFVTLLLIGGPSAVVLSSGRTAAWSAALDLITQRPLMGYGFGSVETLLPSYFPDYVMRLFQGENPHNSYLDMAVELGILGLALITVAVVVAFWPVPRAIRKEAREWGDDHAFLSMTVATIVGALVHACFEAWLTSVGSVVAVPFWTLILLGSLWARRPLKRRHQLVAAS